MPWTGALSTKVACLASVSIVSPHTGDTIKSYRCFVHEMATKPFRKATKQDPASHFFGEHLWSTCSLERREALWFCGSRLISPVEKISSSTWEAMTSHAVPSSSTGRNCLKPSSCPRFSERGLHSQEEIDTGRPRFIALHKCCVFHKLKVVAASLSASLSNSICVAVQSFAQYFPSFCYYYICHGDLRSVISDIATAKS